MQVLVEPSPFSYHDQEKYTLKEFISFPFPRHGVGAARFV
jgi:hypothetical protein